MVVTKKKTKKKPRPDAGGDTPITVGGGGDGKIADEVTIDFDPGAWTPSNGKLTLNNGKVKTLKVTCRGTNIEVDVKGTLNLIVTCNRP
jgi:hypothetical protein